jgi:hypothetical protein
MEGTGDEPMVKVLSGSVCLNQLMPDVYLWYTPVAVNILTLKMAARLPHVSELIRKHLNHRCTNCWLL